LKWLDHHRSDPVTHAPARRHRLTPNLSLRHLIEMWIDTHDYTEKVGKVEEVAEKVGKVEEEVEPCA
jgi:hypothetical protein